jgi:hypothetical protein
MKIWLRARSVWPGGWATGGTSGVWWGIQPKAQSSGNALLKKNYQLELHRSSLV